MDGEPSGTTGETPVGVGAAPARNRGLLIGLAVLVVGLVVFSAVALVGENEPSPSPPRPTSALPSTTARGQSTTVVPSPTVPTGATPAGATPSESTPAGGSTLGGNDSGSGPGGDDGLPGYDSGECALFRDLLAMIDDPALRAGAARVGCI